VDDGIAKVEAMLKEKPDDRRALGVLLASTQAKATQMATAGQRKESIPVFARSAQAARKLRDSHKNLAEQEKGLIGQALYNEACSIAIGDKPDEAMAVLKEAVDAGFNDKHQIEIDDELVSLRKRPDYADLLKRVGPAGPGAAKGPAEDPVAKVASLLKENKPFPFAMNLPDLDGKPVTLDDLKGKVVIVDIWGTWCPPCRKEIPHFVDLYKEYHDKGLEIVGVNYEDETGDEAKKVIRKFLDENKVPYRCVIGDDKTQKQVPDFEGYPTTLFLDRTGKVRLKLVGLTEKAELEQIVKTLLAEK